MDCQKVLAERLMGQAVYRGKSSLLKPDVGKFVRSLLVSSWNRYRKTVRRDMDKISRDVKIVKEAWLGECDDA